MKTELILLLLSLLLGVISRIWFVGLLRTEKRVGRPAAITLEFLSMGLLTSAYIVLVYFIGDGVFMPFTLIAAMVGFMAASIFI